MPEEFRAYGESWLKHHPGWTMQLWGDDNLPPMRNRDLFDTAPTYASKSDILRFEVVWQFGGVYLDTDIECFYNPQRIQKRLGYRSPADFESAAVA